MGSVASAASEALASVRTRRRENKAQTVEVLRAFLKGI